MSALMDPPLPGPGPADPGPDGPGGPPEPGWARSWLVAERRRLEGAEPAWLDILVDYDLSEAWKDDGFPACAVWLSYACGMARSTAYEKLRVGHQLRRRPLVRAAFCAGEISYSAVRSICSLDSPDPEVDEALVELARTEDHLWLERAVRHYQLLDDEVLGRRFRREERRGVVIQRGYDGLGYLRATLTNDEVETVEVLLRAFMEPVGVEEKAAAESESAAADSSTGGGGGGAGASAAADSSTGATGRGGGASAVADSSPGPIAGGPFDDDLCDADGPDPSAAADSSTGPADERADEWYCRWTTRRADALVEACVTALAHAQGGRALGVDRYMVHVVADAEVLGGSGHGRCELVDGSPLGPGELARICCDSSVVAHLVDTDGQPLALGRRSRTWTLAQRRAVAVRDAGRCRFPGCFRRRNDVHHVIPWENGGPTDISNAVSLCHRHHCLVHDGFRTEGRPDGELVFFQPQGLEIGRSSPPGRLPRVA